MEFCQTCGKEIVSQDRFCRNCGALVNNSVAELTDTSRFNPAAVGQTAFRADPTGSQQLTNPLYSAPPIVPSYQTGSVTGAEPTTSRKKKIFRALIWPLGSIVLALLLFAGMMAARDEFDPTGNDFAVETPEEEQRNYDAAIQNALGFRQGEISDAEFPDVKGIFIDNLMSDDSPAALSKIQAGDVMTELNNQPVRNTNELAQVLGSLKTGDDIPVKFYRDGETIATTIKIADPTYAPFQQKIEPRDQGYLGIKDAGRRCCIPGSKRWGVEINEILDNTPADLFGLKPGDVVTEFNGHPIKTSYEFNRRIRSVKPRSTVKLKFYRGSVEQVIDVLLGHRWE